MVQIKCNQCGYKKDLTKEKVMAIRTRYGMYDETTATILDRVKDKFHCTKCHAKDVEILTREIG